MDLALFTRNRLKQLRLSPRDLARASSMAESNIADLLDPNSLQTASKRTHVHDQLEQVLRLPHGLLAKLADLQRREHLKNRLEHPGSQGGQSISYPFPARGGPAPSSCSFPSHNDRPTGPVLLPVSWPLSSIGFSTSHSLSWRHRCRRRRGSGRP